MSCRRLFGLLVVRWGFALWVGMAIMIGVVAAATVDPPTDAPAIALQAAVVYRVEVGVAVFFGLYLAALAFALAVQNRASTEIGSSGIRARDLASVSEDPASKTPPRASSTNSSSKWKRFSSTEKGFRMPTERGIDSNEEIRARHERMRRRLAELRAAVYRKKAVVEEWRAEGLLPPEEPRRRF